ncbi:hypothetical protein [Hymenobacter sp. AT01-02]|nr:hypothetical protein [Hymenobacter sp. AT01-02]
MDKPVNALSCAPIAQANDAELEAFIMHSLRMNDGNFRVFDYRGNLTTSTVLILLKTTS